MALVVKDRVKETTTTTGTGTLTLAGSSSGYQSFAAIGNGNSTYYVITDVTSGAWEVGIGTYTASGTTLSRDTVLSSSNSGSLVSFGAGVKDVFVAYPSERAVYLDSAGSYPVQSTFNTLTATTANLTNGTVASAPSSGTDITNKTYVDTVATTAIDFHEPVRGEVPNTTGNLTATYNNGTAGVGATLTNAGTQATFAYGGVSWNTSDRVLIYNQTDATQNGVYTITDLGSGSTNWVLTRATDADSYGVNDPNALDQGSSFFIQEGDGAGETYACNTSGVITFGTTAITFAQISSSQIYSAGTGLTLTGTQFSITNTGTAGTYGSASAVPVLTTNAQGQVTSVTNTTIAIAGSQVSGAISGQAGSVANSLTLGTYLTGGSFNGSSPVTATVDATSANTASKVVARDASGNFSAGTITASLSGNATTATTSTNLAGGAANQIPYQTASGTTSFITAASGTDYVLNFNGSTFTWVAGTISGVPLGSNLSSLSNGAYLTWSSGTNFNGSAASTLAVDATSANTASKVVARDASGNFSAGTITAALSGNATTATTATTANALNTANSYTVAGLTLNNGLADGAGVVFNSQGFTSWEIDNTNGALRFFQPGTTYGSWTTSGLTVTGSVTATALAVSSTLTASGSATFSTTTGNLSLGTSQTTGTTTIGGTAQTGAISVGRSTATNTINIGTGVTASGSTQTINFGTGGASGSTTNINVGSANGSTMAISGAATLNGLPLLTANAGGAVVENKQTVTGTTTMTAGSNGMSVGPITISSGASFTVGSGQRWVIL